MKNTSYKVQSSNTVQRKVFDLEDRFAVFGENIIVFCKELTLDTITRPLVSQIVRSATSIGANYSEANNASSRKDFRNKVYIAKKESQETKHWLRMIEAAQPEYGEQLATLRREVHEICLILQAITNKIDSGGDA